MLSRPMPKANPGNVESVNDGYLPSGRHFLYYRETGSGDLVLFIHAGVADSRMWIPQLEAVPDGFKFVAFDQRGFGNSEVGDEEYATHADAIAVLDYFGAETAVIIGCSIGAGTALQVAIDAPDRVTGLVLVGGNSPGVEPPNGYYEPPQWSEAVSAFEAGDFEKAARLDAEMWVIGHGRDMSDVDGEITDLVIEMDLQAMQSEARVNELRHPGPDKASGIASVDVPTLVMVGAFDLPDEVMWAHDLAAKLSDSEAVVIENAAHLAGLEQPEAFNRALFEFLATL